ncbi:hypothetical protein [Aquirufa ecclesiirivi]|uniref:hypothetical protein n=1 Tax=Aquirufa ecclesiirivi TaxID=2715124 RepID=UPI003BB04FA7
MAHVAQKSWFLEFLENQNLTIYNIIKSECCVKSENEDVILIDNEGLPTLCINREEVEKWFEQNNLP